MCAPGSRDTWTKKRGAVDRQDRPSQGRPRQRQARCRQYRGQVRGLLRQVPPKRNVIDYTRSHVATESEASQIVQQAAEFYEFVEAWVESSFPNLQR